MNHNPYKDLPKLSVDNGNKSNYLEGEEIVISDQSGKEHLHVLMKYVRSNQDTCINQKPIVNEGDKVLAGDVIADGASTSVDATTTASWVEGTDDYYYYNGSVNANANIDFITSITAKLRLLSYL